LRRGPGWVSDFLLGFRDQAKNPNWKIHNEINVNHKGVDYLIPLPNPPLPVVQEGEGFPRHFIGKNLLGREDRMEIQPPISLPNLSIIFP
jgi:hypothetical protein